MQLSNRVKIIWWLVVTAGLTFFLRERLPDLLSGNAKAADIAVFGVWMALLLAPLFSEVSLLGVTLKNEIEELKGVVSAQLTDIRTEVRSAVDVRTTFSPQFHMPAPVSDAYLPQLEERIMATVKNVLAAQGRADAPVDEPAPVSPDVSFLFATRYSIEREIRRLAAERDLVDESRFRVMPIAKVTELLASISVIDHELARAIREVYTICSWAIHGEEVSEAKVAFVRDVASKLVTALKAIQLPEIMDTRFGL